ncbi:MAG: glycosyltransferase family 2 protein [Bacillota bacterium]
MSAEISILVPVYNSEKTLEKLYVRICSAMDQLPRKAFEIILIDDGSEDQSYEVCKALHERDERVKSIRLSRNFGQQNALMCGFHFAQGGFVFTIDDDLQHPPEEIQKLYEKLNKGYDVVFGIPDEKKHPFYRNIGTKMIDRLLNRICKKPKGIKVSSFRGLRKDVVTKIVEDKTSFVYLAPMIFKVTRNAANVSVDHAARIYGKSNYSFLKLAVLYSKLAIYYSSFFKYLNCSSHPQFEIRDRQL